LCDFKIASRGKKVLVLRGNLPFLFWTVSVKLGTKLAVSLVFWSKILNKFLLHRIGETAILVRVSFVNKQLKKYKLLSTETGI